MSPIVPFFCFLGALIITPSFANDIWGCNGFIKCNVEINFTQIEIKLMTKQGTLKDHTECAPNNGYYFLPLYDKGEYVLKVAAPSGWTFEPSEFHLNADGVTDHCSLNKDINFKFKGFSIYGNVVGIGEQNGPQGIKVTLTSSSNKITETQTEKDGSFQFKTVLPDKYVIHAYHTKWRFQKSHVTVQVKSDNVQVPPNSLVVSGYDVAGKITSENEPVQGVHFVAFAENAQKVVKLGCETDKLSSFTPPGEVKDMQPVCYVTSNEKGDFLFPSLSPGQYALAPFHQHEANVTVEIQPAVLRFSVAHDSVVLDTVFQIMGFSVVGRVLSSQSGGPVANALIYVDEREVTRSAADGFFTLEAMRTGTYRLGVRTEDMRFSDVELRALPTSAARPVLIPSAYKVCGQVRSAAAASSSDDEGEPPRLVVFTWTAAGGEVVFEETWSKARTGEFCLFLAPGRYHASIAVSEADRAKTGLQFAPLKREVIVRDSVVTGINFSQLKATLKGRVQCLDPELCSDFALLVRNTVADQSVHEVVVKNGEYWVSNMLPGEYEIVLRNGGDWCWERATVRVAIDSQEATAPTLKQTGVAVTFVSSHSTKVKYMLESSGKSDETVTGELTLAEGVTAACVPRNGAYVFTPVGCHGYGETQFKWRSGQGRVTLTALSHRLAARIVADRAVTDLTVRVVSSQNRAVNRLGPLKAVSASPGQYEYPFRLQLAPLEQITVTPAASQLLFFPQTISYIGHSDCQVADEYFTAETGKLIEGAVKPPLADVMVRVSNKVGALLDNRTTDAQGKYKFGPFRMHEELVVTAEKEGYVLSGPDARGDFEAHKLAEIVVEVRDRGDARPLSGVLVSLSGGQSYRRNALTGEDGKVSFRSLSPNEYYVRPMMKEYMFEPASPIFNVTGAASTQVKWRGVRVAYSALGSVTSVDREPDAGVTVVAVGVPSPTFECDQLQEEAVTESNGQFRIRGLKPQCDYEVRLKSGPDVNPHIERALPSKIPVQVADRDVTLPQSFATLRSVATCDISVLVTSQHLRSLTLKLFRGRGSDPIAVLKLAAVPHLSEAAALVPLAHVPLAEAVRYSLVLETSLSKNVYDLARERLSREFLANATFELVSFVFDPSLRKESDHALGDASNVFLCALVVSVGALALGLNHYKRVGAYVRRVRQEMEGLLARRLDKREKESGQDSAVLIDAVHIVKRKSRAK